MGQRENANDAVVKVAQIKLSKEEFALSMKSGLTSGFSRDCPKKKIKEGGFC